MWWFPSRPVHHDMDSACLLKPFGLALAPGRRRRGGGRDERGRPYAKVLQAQNLALMGNNFAFAHLAEDSS
uniref:Uncharacterized protein n=1 Tax=Sphaerodactylus townsendi TaxID=933632 RepID=A0ACB8FZ42_9SAUR